MKKSISTLQLYIFLGIGLLITSYLAFWFSIVNILMFAILLLSLVYAMHKKIEYGLYIALFEILIGSQGYLFYITLGEFKLSLRLGIFAVFFVYYLFSIIKNKRLSFLNYELRNNYILFAAMLLIGIVTGYLNGNSFGNIFLDVNGYFYFAYIIPAIDLLKTKEHYNELKRIFVSGVSVAIIHSLSLLYVFSHMIVPWMRPLYKWTRDHRLGEIVRPFIGNDFHRIFFQHQIFSVFAFLMVVAVLFLSKNTTLKERKYQGLFFFASLNLCVILLSFSRSYWVALAITCLLLGIYIVYVYRLNLRQYLKITGYSIGIAILSVVLLTIVINIPIPPRGSFIDSSDLFKNRLNFTDEAAVSSRWSQLPFLKEAVSEHPIIGSGFGTTVTYKSQDPRILNETNPEGWYTTYAFEWGYLDIFLKIGIIGIAVYGILLYTIAKQLFYAYIVQPVSTIKYELLGIVLAYVCLLGIHMFTPYINHPLGISFIIYTSVIAHIYRDRTEIKIIENN